MSKLKLYYPVKPWIVTQQFGEVANLSFYKKNNINITGHNGIDALTKHGQPVYAAHSGICYPGVDNKEGHGVVIRSEVPHEYNGEMVHMKSVYWHLVKGSATVKTGDRVQTGDLIGYADSTGLSTGDHLHFSIKPQLWNENDWIWYNLEQSNGMMGAVDPNPYFTKEYAIDVKIITIQEKLVELLKLLIEKLSKK